MTQTVTKQASPRHGFEFDRMPTVKASMYGGSYAPYPASEYGLILDSVYEMADAVATSNGVSIEDAIEQVLKDENWRVLPTHKRMIADRFKS